jgi:hypothetical protein
MCRKPDADLRRLFVKYFADEPFAAPLDTD